MPSSTRPATPGTGNAYQTSKRIMSDVESPPPQDSKKARIIPSAESTTRDSNRDARRRRRRKKKAPVVNSAVRNDATQSRLDGPSRIPLSPRNDISRLDSLPSEADLAVSVVAATKHSSSTSLGKSRGDSSDTLDEHHGRGALPNKEHIDPTTRPLPGPSSSSLAEKVTQLEAELKFKNDLIASHQALLNQVQQSVTCQVCLDLMYKPYALAPCGHLACHTCLVNWFTAPSPDNQLMPPPLMRKKTCPHCRAVVRERPVEVWGVKSIAQATGKSSLLLNQFPAPATESIDVNTDPWKDIFPKAGITSHRIFPWLFPGADVDDDDDAAVHIADAAPRSDDVGMLDMEDGGIYRCLDCMHEIWGGVCSNCGRVYSGHRPEGDEDDEEGPVGWLEDQMGAEEVDVADDPGWMGLEDGEADEGDYVEDWGAWRRPFRGVDVFRGPLGFLGTIHVDEEDEEDDDDLGHGLADGPWVADEDGDDGYESSFIDDGDEDGGVADIEDGPRIYEIEVDDEDSVDRASDDADESSPPPSYWSDG